MGTNASPLLPGANGLPTLQVATCPKGSWWLCREGDEDFPTQGCGFPRLVPAGLWERSHPHTELTPGIREQEKAQQPSKRIPALMQEVGILPRDILEHTAELPPARGFGMKLQLEELSTSSRGEREEVAGKEKLWAHSRKIFAWSSHSRLAAQSQTLSYFNFPFSLVGQGDRKASLHAAERCQNPLLFNKIPHPQTR